MDKLIVLLAAILFAFPAFQEFLLAILAAVPTGA